MNDYSVKILSIQDITHNVRSYRVEKPNGYHFDPGQATEVSIDKAGWQDEKRPFTFTSLNDWPFLEFTIKSYHDHNGVTNELYKLVAGDKLIIRDVWGAIAYKGPGYFLAGGAGITPFIAILRQAYRENAINGNELFFSNKTSGDIIYHAELSKMLGSHVKYILTREEGSSYLKGPIDKEFLKREITDFTKPCYICGPDKMVGELSLMLTELGANPDAVIFEK